jgi:hypothetical protein
LLIASCFVVCATACSRQAPKAAASATAAGQTRTDSLQGSGSLPRREITLADRARWFSRLGWPQDCEDAFMQTRVTDDPGLEIHALPSGASIAVIRCALGAYQPTSVVLRFDERSPAHPATLLEFPTFESSDGQTLVPARTRELTGEIEWLEGVDVLMVLTLARQIGDCGTWAKYGFPNDVPTLTAFASRVSCPDDPEPAVDPRAGEPPDGWSRMTLR